MPISLLQNPSPKPCPAHGKFMRYLGAAETKSHGLREVYQCPVDEKTYGEAYRYTNPIDPDKLPFKIRVAFLPVRRGGPKSERHIVMEVYRAGGDRPITASIIEPAKSLDDLFFDKFQPSAFSPNEKTMFLTHQELYEYEIALWDKKMILYKPYPPAKENIERFNPSGGAIGW